MTSYNWATNISGDWNTGTLWTPAGVPSTATADVTIDAATTLAYTVTIAAGVTATVNSLSMNASNFAGTSGPGPYAAAELELDGTLAFAAGSPGLFDGSQQTFVHQRAGTSAAILNAGTVNAFIQAEGALLLTGTNTITITNEIQALGGTVTIAAPFGDIAGNTLIDGIFAATGAGATINFGGAGGPVVNIATIFGAASLFDELTLDGATAAINEWNGTKFVALETTLTEIDAGGTVDIRGGRDYISNNSLTVGGAAVSPDLDFTLAALLNLQAGRVAFAGGININDGVVQGYGTIDSAIVNNATLIALGGTIGGTLAVSGSLTGTGEVAFDRNASTGGDPTEATLLLHAVSAGQTITLNDGGDTLILVNPASFAGTIVAGMGGRITLQGAAPTRAVLNGGTLVVKSGAQTVASLALAGSYTGDSFVVDGSIVTIVALPTIAGTTPGQSTSDDQAVTPFANISIADTNAGQTETVSLTLAPENGRLGSLGDQNYNASTGTYTITGTAAAVTAALRSLVFTPTPHQITPGLTVATRFTVRDIDTAGKIATDTTTTVIATAETVLPTISGTAAGQPITDQGTIHPFANVVIDDANFGQNEIVKVSLDATDGTLTNWTTGSYDAADGIYNVSGSPASVTAALNALVFFPTPYVVAPGATNLTTFAITVSDTAKQAITDWTTTVITTAVAVPPTISIDVSTQVQPIFDQSTISPLAGVVIDDANVGQTETVTVTLATLANGTLSPPALGDYNPATGVYTVVGDAGTVTSALHALRFTPNLHQVAPGQSVSTTFIVNDTDSASQPAISNTVTVVATAAAVAPTILGGGLARTISDLGTATPFVGVAVADANFGQTETLTVTLSAHENGTLTGPAAGTYDPVHGIYTVTGTAAEVTAAIDALIFVPTPHQVAPEQAVTTVLTVRDTDDASQVAIPNTTTIVAKATTSAPKITLTQARQSTTDQQTIKPFTHATIADANFGQTETVTVTVLGSLNGTLGNLGGGIYDALTDTYRVIGSADAVTTALQGWIFTPTPHQQAPGQQVLTSLLIQDIDSVGQSTNDPTTTVMTTIIAAQPAISGTIAGQSVSDASTIAPFANVAIEDANFGQAETVTVKLSNKANGTLSSSGGGTYDPNTGIYTIGALLVADVTQALRGLVFTPTLHQVTSGQSVTTTFTISDTDTAGQPATDSTTTVVATAGAVAPTITGTGPNQTSDQVPIRPFAGVVIADGNPAPTETVTVTLSDKANGTLTCPAGGIYNAATGVYAISGTAAAVTAALDALLFTATPHQVVPTLTVSTTFIINDTDSASKFATDSKTTVIVIAIAVPPTISGAAGSHAVSDQTTISPFAHVVIADDNIGQNETVTVAMSAANGTWSNLGNGTVSNGVYTAAGDAAAVTAALEGLAFTPTLHQTTVGNSVTTTFTISAIDTAGRVANDTTTTIIATAAGAPPTMTGIAKNLSASDQGTINPFANVVIADADPGQLQTVIITLSAPANGTLGNLGGGTYSPTTGTYSITGTAADVTASLNALVFTPTPRQVSPGQAVTTAFTIDDTDTAALRAIEATTTLVATAASRPPTIGGTVAAHPTTDQRTITPFASVVIGDANPGQTETVTVTLSAAGNGTLSNLGSGTYNTQTGVYSVTGTPSQVTAALTGLIFIPTAQQVAPGQTVTTNFTIGDVDTASQTATDATTSVVASAAALPPTITGITARQQTSNQSTIAPFAHVVIADANAGQTESVTLTLSGSANFALSNLRGGSYNATTGVYTVIGTAAAVTTALAALVCTPQASTSAVATNFAIAVTDTAGASAVGTVTTVTSMPPTPATVILNGSSTQYIFADNDGSLFLQDTVPGNNPPALGTGTTVMALTDGTGVFDPTGTAEDVARLYQAALDRAPDVLGLQGWTADIDIAKASLSAVAGFFVASPEFIQDYGKLSGEQFVQQLYLNVLNRPADGPGLANWTGALTAGMSRGDVTLGFSQSAEFKIDMLPFAGDKYSAEAYRLYVAALNRLPEQDGLINWAAALASGMTPIQAAQGFINSQEFQLDYPVLTPADFVTTLYHNVLHREPDPGGQQAWTGALLGGASNASVLLAFSDCVENRLQTAAATHANWVFIPNVS